MTSINKVCVVGTVIINIGVCIHIISTFKLVYFREPRRSM